MPSDELRESDSLDEITEVARKRLEAAHVEIDKKRPSFLLDIIKTEVVYTMRPQLIPLNQLNWVRFKESMEEIFSANGDSQDLRPLLETYRPDELGAMAREEVMQSLLRTLSPVLAFSDGRFPSGPGRSSSDDYVPINAIRITREAIHANVSGPTSVGEAVVALTFEEIWKHAGFQRVWEDAYNQVQLVGYATATLVDLGVNFIETVNPNVRSFFDEEVVAGREFGAHAGDYVAGENPGPPNSTSLLYALDSMDFQLFRFDLTTGRRTETKVGLDVVSRGDYNTGEIVVSTELPFDEHLDFVAGLISRLGAE